MTRIRLSGDNRKQLGDQIKADIDAAIVAQAESGHRDHLGASLIGHDCKRYLWYVFRWMHEAKHDARQMRLFNRGHITEPRLIKWIEDAGLQVWSHSADGKQFRIHSASGHFGGSLDSVGRLPIDRFNLDIPFLLEFKTHNDRNFKLLVKNKVRLSHPKHFVQMSTYGKFYNFDYAIYFGLNKNDDDLHVEVVALDHELGAKQFEIAEKIINSPAPPPKIAASVAFDKCKWCDMKGICHLGDPVDVNCRTCINSNPVDNGGWFCKLHNSLLPNEIQRTGCDQWQELPTR